MAENMTGNTVENMTENPVEITTENTAENSTEDMAENPADLPKGERIELAIAECQKENGISARKAAKKYNVAPSTVTRRLNHSVQSASVAHQSRQRLTPQEEKLIIRKALQHYESGLPLGIRHLHEFANEILCSKDTEAPEIGHNWHRRMLARNPSIKRILSRPPARVRTAKLMRKDTLDEFFALYSDLRKTHAIASTDVYNMDEKGLLTGANQQSSVLIPMEKRQAYMRQEGNRQWASVLECISADGEALPAWMVFKVVNQPNSGFKHLGTGESSIAISEKEWTSNVLALHWLQEHFHPLTEKRRHGEYRMLIVDGHGSQCTPEFVDFCVKAKIILLILPPHNTRLVQPLDAGTLQPLVQGYSNFLDDHKRFCKTWLNKEDLIKYYQLARKQAINNANIMAGWKRTGLFPFNPQEVLHQLPNLFSGPSRSPGASSEPPEDPF
ncbi:hypothetical protein EPUS_06298 [Endocarpon pusillum Z07020]|uniref:HTH CENPB-type domain-containing protein n=1 Tax=Endocarpon pusillum (strain Z07020 / HMAS-L-300199) TaxID=1263415 RepID=U1I1E7_ENDPU|nr:uncharacterized protein EPUS_06298 [Endocarpon pusillum Z07020]ERF77080.1 hypothetical protein EPUS_06298 [Endocarpon pusillum Z07020]